MFSKSKKTILTFVCGLLSGVAFFVSVAQGNGLLIMLLPTLPLALLGLSMSAKHCLFAVLIGCVTLGIVLDGDYVPLFFLLSAFPTYHFVRKVLLWRGSEEAREWFPTLAVIAEITAYAAALFMMLALLSVTHSDHSELKDLVASALAPQLENPDPKVASIVKSLVEDWSFLIFAGLGWIWILLLYFFIASANMILTHYHLSLRSSLAISRGGLPGWLPVLLLLSACVVSIGNANDRFVGETVFLTLLLPYFLCGIASVQQWLQGTKNREFWLTLFYLVLLVFFPWIAMLLIAWGIKTQAENFFKEKPENL